MQRIPPQRRRDPPLLRNRREKKVQPKSDKLFGRYDDLLRLIIGFVLTGIVGAYLTQRYTTSQANLTEAGKVFSAHSKLLGDRYFSQNRLHRYFQQIDQEGKHADLVQLASRLSAYQESVREWNSARGFNREMIRLYFGDRNWNDERDLHYVLRGWGNTLQARVEGKGQIDYACIEQEIDGLLVALNGFRISMAQAMQEGKVGLNKKNESVQANSHPESLCLKVTPPP